MSKEEEAKRVIDLVETLKAYFVAKEHPSHILSLPPNVVELGEGRYRIKCILMEYRGGIEYMINGEIPVKVFRDGTYGIHDFRVDSEGNIVK